MRLETKRHIFKFYFSVIFGFLFFFLMGIFSISQFFDDEERLKAGNKIYLILLLGIVFVALAFYTISQYIKSSPKIIIERNRIFFNKESFNLNDIQFLNLTCKVPFRYILKFPMEGFYIEFKNGTEKFIYDDMYSNVWKIKDYLKQVVEDEKEYKSSNFQVVKLKEIKNIHIAYYKGIFNLLTLRGISLWVMVLLLVGILSKLLQKQPLSLIGIAFITFPMLFWYYMSAWFMHYYGISRNYFIVKNFYLPWRVRVFRLEEIEQIVFEQQQRSPNGLRVISKNYQTKLFYGGTLSDNHWRELKKDLRKKGIKVRDECIDYEY